MKSKFIDYAKGFSMLTIVTYHFLINFHFPKILFYAVQFGGAGVHLFFFASGFGLAASNYTTYFKFLSRRLNKVLIPYYIAITLICLINLVIHIYPNDLGGYLSHIFLYKMFIPKYEIIFGKQFWFISTIIQFYLVLPLLLWILNFKKYKTIFAVSLSISLLYSLVISFSPYSSERVANSFFLQYLWEFMLGMIISRTGVLNKLISGKTYYFLLLTVINIGITGLLAIKGGSIGKNLNDVFSFTAYTSVIILLYKLGEQFSKQFNKFIFWIGSFSFTLYLFHMLIWDAANTNNIYNVPLILAITIVICYFYDVVFNVITKKGKSKLQKAEEKVLIVE